MDLERIERALREPPPGETRYVPGRYRRIGSRRARARVRVRAAPGRLGLGFVAVIAIVASLVLRPNPAAVAPGSSQPASSPSASPSVRAGSFPMYKGGPGRTGESSTAGPGPGSTILWSVPVGLGLRSSPAIDSGFAYVVGGGRRLMALSLADGDIRWTAGSAFAGSPAVGDGRILVLGSDFSMSAVAQSDGHTIWSTPASLHPDSAPLLVEGRVVAGGSDGIDAFDAATGRLLWRAGTAGPVVRAVASDGRLVYGGGGGRLDAVELATGRPVWSSLLTGGDLATPSVRDGVVVEVGGPADHAFVVALDAATGAERWRSPASGGVSYGTPAMDGQRVYVAASDGGIVALSRTDGARLWVSSTPPIGEPALGVAQNGVFGFTTTNTFVGVHPGSGSLLVSVDLRGGVSIGTAIGDGFVVAGTSSGEIVEIGTVATGIP